MRIKLTATTACAIYDARCEWNCPKVRRQIAKMLSRFYDVSVKTVRDIWQGRTWAEVTGLPNRSKYCMQRHCAPGSIDYELFEWAETTQFIDPELLGVI